MTQLLQFQFIHVSVSTQKRVLLKNNLLVNILEINNISL